MDTTITQATIERLESVVPVETWRRLAEKAHRQGLHAFRLNDDARTWAVTSHSQPGTAYEVTILDGDLLCSCPGSAYYPYCKHRALVLDELGLLGEFPDRPERRMRSGHRARARAAQAHPAREPSPASG
ncbi:hypothetical protein HRbin26_00163 [bacterium HR26]|nr:hypothetical protein HRbin26_00163 [bacterium HR26]